MEDLAPPTTEWNIPVFQVKLKHPKAKLPWRATTGSAGFDIISPEEFVLLAYETKVVDTGLAIALPQGYFGMLATRSSMAVKGVDVRGGICDSDYRGNIMVILANRTNNAHLFSVGHKIAQLLILPYIAPLVHQVNEFTDAITERGEQGFGSSDTKK